MSKAISLPTISKRATKEATKEGWKESGNLFSLPSKMPGFSFSLPAGKTCPAGKVSVSTFGDCAICKKCYAKKGNYCRPNVKASQDAKLRNLAGSLGADNGDTWVSMMVAALEVLVDHGETLFRVHDSGDLFSERYINAWTRVCEAVPGLFFWFPTREWARPSQMPALRELAACRNVRVRMSALKLDEPAPDHPELRAGSSVYTDPKMALRDGQEICPATLKGNPAGCEANNCKKCWFSDSPIAYMAH